jgi:hypothetical protein
MKIGAGTIPVPIFLFAVQLRTAISCRYCLAGIEAFASAATPLTLLMPAAGMALTAVTFSVALALALVTAVVALALALVAAAVAGAVTAAAEVAAVAFTLLAAAAAEAPTWAATGAVAGVCANAAPMVKVAATNVVISLFMVFPSEF